MSESGRYVVIGLGGVGGLVLRLLVPFLSQQKERATVLAVDGDAFEERNRERMVFRRPGPKANVLTEELAESYGDRVTLLPVAEYVAEENAAVLIAEGDIVFCQPDNHATRRLVETRCLNLADAVLFSGGNDGVEEGGSGTIGNVQIFQRQAGRNVTNPISTYHPEIAEPGDALPTSEGCAAMSESAPQLLFANAAVASAMMAAFYAFRQGALRYEEVYFDIATGRSVPVQRALLA